MVHCTTGRQITEFLDIQTILQNHYPELHVQLYETAKITDMKTQVGLRKTQLPHLSQLVHRHLTVSPLYPLFTNWQTSVEEIISNILREG